MAANKIPQEKWDKMKSEYVNGLSSICALERKYGVHKSSISERAKKEKWQELRQSISEKAEQIAIEVHLAQLKDNTEIAEGILKELLIRVMRGCQATAASDVQSTRQLIQCMKDLADMGVFAISQPDNAIEIGFADEEIREYAQ